MVTRRATRLIALGALGAALTGPAPPLASGLTLKHTCGPALCIQLPRGSSSSVGPGIADGRPAAWVLVGDFRFPADAATHEGSPSVPPGKVLISVGDFPVASAFVRWPHVTRLRLPHSAASKRVTSWHVLYLGRAVSLSVRFGSTPDPRLRGLVNATLSTVHRQ